MTGSSRVRPAHRILPVPPSVSLGLYMSVAANMGSPLPGMRRSASIRFLGGSLGGSIKWAGLSTTSLFVILSPVSQTRRLFYGFLFSTRAFRLQKMACCKTQRSPLKICTTMLRVPCRIPHSRFIHSKSTMPIFVGMPPHAQNPKAAGSVVHHRNGVFFYCSMLVVLPCINGWAVLT